MWPTALAFFEQAGAASPAGVIAGSLELVVEGVREEKLTARARRAALDMSRSIRELAAADAAVRRLVSAAFSAMATATRIATMRLSYCPGASALRSRSPPSCASA
eukprot:5667892-Pleurochrysis_carterae.AAC.1